MLIPIKKYLSCDNEYCFLKKFSINTKDIDNLIIINMIKNSKGALVPDNTQFYKNIYKLINNADMTDEDFIVKQCQQYTYKNGKLIPIESDNQDEEIIYDGWMSKNVIRNFCNGSDHLNNYKKFKNIKKLKGKNINIIDSFLILEVNDFHQYV